MNKIKVRMMNSLPEKIKGLMFERERSPIRSHKYRGLLALGSLDPPPNCQ